MLWPQFLGSSRLSKPKSIAPTESPDGTIDLLPAHELLLAHREWINRIEELASTTRSHFQAYYLPVMNRYAAWSQQLPASQGHSAKLLEHGLETATRVLRIRQGYLLPPGAPPEQAILKKDVWTYAVFTLALLSHAECPLCQTITVYESDGITHRKWNPWSGSLTEDPRIRWYRIEKEEPNGNTLDQRTRALLALRLVPPEGMAWLSSDPAVFSAWLGYLMGDLATAGICMELMRKAGADPVVFSGKSAFPIPPRLEKATPEPIPFEPDDAFFVSETTEPPVVTPSLGQLFLQWLQQELANGNLSYNHKNSLVHVVEDGVFLVSPAIFKTYEKTQNQPWETVQKAFCKLKLHTRNSAHANWHRYLHSEGNTVSGLLLSDASLLFGPEAPSPGSHLRRE